MRFVTRHSYRRGLDGTRVSQLHADWQQSFEAVTQWQEKGFEKPKFHQGEHLELALDQFGPFRAFWCMPWEGFLQLLKHMFEISNWKTAPYTVCKHWATKSVMHYRDPARASWYARHARHTPRTPRRTRHTRRKPHTPRPARAATRATPMMHPAGVSLRDSPSQRKVRPSWAPSTGEGASDTHGPPRAPGRQINSSLPVRTAEAPHTNTSVGRQSHWTSGNHIRTTPDPLLIAKLRYLFGFRPGKESLAKFEKAAGTWTNSRRWREPRLNTKPR